MSVLIYFQNFSHFFLQRWKSFLILLTGIAFTAYITTVVYREEEMQAKTELSDICVEVKNKIDTRLQAYAQLLISGAAYLSSSDTVTRKEWNEFAGFSRIEKNLPGTQGIGYAQIISGTKLQAHISFIRKEGFPGYNVRPEGNREIYTSIVFIEPFRDRNLRAFGYDMYSEVTRRKAMELSRDNNEPCLSGKVILVQETGRNIQAGTLMYMPVYKKNMPIGTLEERRAAIKGWVYSPYRMNDLMYGILGLWDSTINRIHLQIYDENTISDDALLFDSQSGFKNTHLSRSIYLPVEFNGKKWTLLFRQPTQFFLFASNKVWIVLICGIIISLLLYFLTLSLLNTRSNAEKIASQLTLKLREAENRFSLFMDHLPAIAFLKDDKGRTLFVNKHMDKALDANKWMGKTMTEVFPNETGKRMLSDDMNAMRSGYTKVEETIMQTDGNLHYYETQKFVIRGNNEKNFLGGIALEITDRVNYQKELNRWAQIFEHAQWGIVVGSADGNTIENINPAFAKMHGYTLQEISGKPIQEMFAPECLEDIPVNIKKAHEKGHHIWESVHIRKDGSRFPVLIDVTTVKDAEGKNLYRIVNVMDITERKKIEQALRESEEKLRFAFEFSAVAICMVDGKGKFQWVNKSLTTMLGYTQDELLGKEFNSITFAPDRVVGEIELKRMISGITESATFEKRYVHKHGQIVWASIVVTLIKNVEHEPFFISQITNITDRKLTEQALKDSEEKYHHIFDNAGDAIMVHDSKAKILAVNQTACNIYGYTQEEFLSLYVYDIDHEKENKIADMRISELMQQGYVSFETEHQRKDKSLIAVDVLAKKIMFNGENVILSICRNISEKKKAERELQAYALQLKELNATKDKLFSVIAHDLRNPFNSILGLTELALNDIRDDDFGDLRKMVENINSTAENTMVLLDNLLNWAKSQTGQIAFNPGFHRMKDVTMEIMNIMHASAEIKKISLVYSETGHVSIYADVEMLKTILRNLISNAIKFTNENGRVTIDASNTPDKSVITITDNGVGMTPEILNRLFKVDPTTSKKGTTNEKGSGLGLLLCKEFVDKHSGNIIVTSSPGKGSTFTISLPLPPR